MPDPTLRGEIETKYDALLNPKVPVLPGPRVTAAAASPGPLPPELMGALIGALASGAQPAPPIGAMRAGLNAARRVLGAAKSGAEQVYEDQFGINDETARSMGIGSGTQRALNAVLGPADLLGRALPAGLFAGINAGGQILREAGLPGADQFERDHKAMVGMAATELGMPLASFARGLPGSGHRQFEIPRAGAVAKQGAFGEEVLARGWPQAVKMMRERQSGEAVGHLFHKEIGHIGIPWGVEGTGNNDGYGLAKLLRFHPEVVNDLPRIIEKMKVVSRSPNRIRLESPQFEAGVRLDWDDRAHQWLITAYDKTLPGRN